MGLNTTLLSSAVLALAMFVAEAAGAATLIQCPRVHSEGSKTAPLADADVFDGPPEELASLIPDLDTSEWDLDGYQEDAQDRGEPMYLVCRYAGIKATVTIEIPRTATFCKVEGTRHGTAAVCGTRERKDAVTRGSPGVIDANHTQRKG
jgi:hypothetical protein